jgi:hypothetical protein
MLDLSRRAISPKQLASNGWTPTRGRRNYQHKDGWSITWCGHPTANYPYILEDPHGAMILTGAAVCGRPDYGTCWPTVASAVDYVATITTPSAPAAATARQLKPAREQKAQLKLF